jgi:hypothetical protein
VRPLIDLSLIFTTPPTPRRRAQKDILVWAAVYY